MSEELSSSALKVQQALDSLGLRLQVVELPGSTRTAVEAAQAVGCQVGQIVKSLVFKAKRSERPILVIASGQNRVDEKRLEALIGEPLGKADADFVRQRTGFVIGGVPPVGHTGEIGDLHRPGFAAIRRALGSRRHAPCSIPPAAQPICFR